MLAVVGGTWTDVTVAAAFVLGIVVGGLAVVHVTRNAIDYLREERRSHGGGSDAGES